MPTQLERLDSSCTYKYNFRRDGEPWYYTPDYTYSTYQNVLVRRKDTSETVRSEPDDMGWRNPLPYAASGFKLVPWSGYAHIEGPMNGVWQFQHASSTNFTNNGAWANADVPALGPVDSPFPEWLVTRATNRALTDLKDGVVNYAVMLAESRKSANLVASTANQIYKSLRAVKRGDMIGAAKELGISKRGLKNTFKLKRGQTGYDKQMSRRWLELQYGWTPLLSDVFGVINDFEKGFIREPRIAVTKESKHQDNSVSISHGTMSKECYFLGPVNNRVEHIARVRLDFVLNVPEIRAVAQKGFLNPLEVAWELLPWSFVVDWFTPIGEYLSTLDAATGLTYKGGSVTRFTKQVSAGNLSFTAAPSSTRTASGSCTSTFEMYDMVRTVLHTQPTGGVYFKNPFSASHALNALALLRTVVK